MAARYKIHILNQTIQERAIENSNKYDVVCSFQVLEHVSDVHSFIESSLNCLNPKGYLIYSVSSADSFVTLVQNGILNIPPHHVTWWSDKALFNISDLFGMKLINIYHENLQEIHKDWYASTIAMLALNNFLGRNHSLIDRSLEARFLSKVAFY